MNESTTGNKRWVCTDLKVVRSAGVYSLECFCLSLFSSLLEICYRNVIECGKYSVVLTLLLLIYIIIINCEI